MIFKHLAGGLGNTNLKMLLMLCILSLAMGCNEDALDNVSEIDESLIESRSVNAITLTAVSLANRTGFPGFTFQHKVTLLNGNTPIPNATIGINDPVKLWCTFVTTNSAGQATYNTTTTSATKPGYYNLDFFYGSIHTSSSVAVKKSGVFALSNYTIDIISSPTIGGSSLVAGERDNVQTFQQTLSTTLSNGVNMAKAIGKDYLSNPANLLLITVAVATCTAGQSVPAAGQAGCAVAVDAVVTGIQTSTFKVLMKKGIDKSTNISSANKVALKNLVDVGTNAYGMWKLKAGNGVEILQSASTVWEFDANSYSQLLYNANGVLKGVACTLRRTGTDDCISMTFYKRN